MPFEKFTGGYIPKTNKPALSIDKNGTLRFNKAAIQQFSVDQYDYAAVFYDFRTFRIGISLTDDDSIDGRYKLRKRKDGYNCNFSALPFLRWINYDNRKVRRFYLRRDGESGLLVADLSQTGGVCE